ncbi:cell division cycle-associated protein 7 [Lingula anatina]|uniref:Cell division cycle-associated protein 7 n=1 Tax=Lingula anatina TaxID=7574 RepID=A0A1S3HE40_LINAN|nr:cell division cycle-associated protein 7 [Lingula anatina]|eukprot:XP_013383771.1 cell division cycle-associated protein 7 [Lingula anatina]
MAPKEKSEYEKRRLKNIEDNKAVLAKMMADLKEMMPVSLQSPPKRSHVSKDRRPSGGQVMRRNPSRRARYTPMDYSPPRTRHRRSSVSSSCHSGSSNASTPVQSPGKLVVKFGAFFNKKRKTEDSDDDDSYSVESWEEEEEEEEEYTRLTPSKRKPRAPSGVRYIKPADEVTEEDLELVATHVSEKRYDSAEGTSCHQCRQKTSDMKTSCRSKECFGVRGQFCGPCLRNRYGEDAKEALKNPAWSCPPCRGICNCSFCRKKNGRGATGILIHIAREHGFPDVNSYLNSFKKN